MEHRSNETIPHKKHSDILNFPGEKERNVLRNILTFQNLPAERKIECYKKHFDISAPSWREKERNVIRKPSWREKERSVIRNILTFLNLPGERKREML